MHGFYSPHSAYSKICYEGMDKAFYGTQSPGPA